MSVTDVILCVGLDEKDGDAFPAIDQVNQWLQENAYGGMPSIFRRPEQKLNHLNGNEDGCKAFWQIEVFGGAFSQLDIAGFVAELLSAPWKQLEKVQLIIKDEEGGMLRLINLSDVHSLLPS